MLHRCLLFFLITAIFTPFTYSVPTDNPLREYDFAWTDDIAWSTVVDITTVSGEGWDDKWNRARSKVASQGGGVVYFPAGDYHFNEDLVLEDGVVLRGEKPAGRALDPNFSPATKLIFPQYKPRFEGNGTANDTAFKSIRLQQPERDSHCGVVFVSIYFGAIHFAEGAGHQCGKARFVVGCRLEAAARAIDTIPQDWQHPWQRYTHRHRAAIQVYTAQNALVANNRLANSQQHNFTIPGYKVKNTKNEIVEHDRIVFDYDNRPGIVVNGFAIGAGGGNPPDGTPESHPHGFRTGVQIRDNAIFSTGGYGILFTGDGTVCANNVIRFLPEVYRPTVTGEKLTTGSATNGNRAIEMRGWRYRVFGNEYEVYSNIAADEKYKINDGEGMMHEDHVNSIVKDSHIINNKGNTYISIYKTGGIDGLHIQGNDISSNIFVVANRNSGVYPCKNVRIEENRTPKIYIAGEPGENNIIRHNQTPEGQAGIIKNEANATCTENKGYTIE
jgi:hypothetical protein